MIYAVLVSFTQYIIIYEDILYVASISIMYIVRSIINY